MLATVVDSVGLTDLGGFINLGVLGVITLLWVTKKIGVTDSNERDYLRQENAQLRDDLAAERRDNKDLNESMRRDVVPAITDVARILPIVIDRLTK